MVRLTRGRTQRPEKPSVSGAQTFDCFFEQQGDGTLVVDQHARRAVLIKNDVRHSHVLLQRQQNAPAEPCTHRTNQLLETARTLVLPPCVTTRMSHDTLPSAVHQWAKT